MIHWVVKKHPCSGAGPRCARCGHRVAVARLCFGPWTFGLRRCGTAFAGSLRGLRPSASEKVCRPRQQGESYGSYGDLGIPYF